MSEVMDFSKYQAGEIASKVSGVLDVPGKVVLFGRVLATVLTLVLLSTVGLAIAVGLPWWGYLLLIPYTVAAGTSISAATAVLFLIRAEIAGGRDLLDLLVDTCERIVCDVDGLATGSTPLPSAPAILEGVWVQVFVPAVTMGLNARFGRVAATPAGWVLRNTVGLAVTFMTRVLREDGVDESRVVAEFEAAVQAAHPEMSTHAQHVMGVLGFSRALTVSAVDSIRMVTLPLWVLLACGVLALGLPPALLMHFAG